MNRRGAHVILACLAVVITAMSAMSASSSSREFREFEDLRGKAMSAERAGRGQDAKQFWEQAHAVAPDAFQPLASLASLAAKLGQSDEAFVWLEKAYDGCFTAPILGYFNSSYLAGDDDYSALHSDPRWDKLVAVFQSRCAEGSTRWGLRQTDLDPQSAPSFKSYRKIARAFDRQRHEFGTEQWRLSFAEQHTKTSTIRDQRIAALHRYLAEHPNAGDRADAAWDAVETRIWPRYVERLHDRWGKFGTQVLEEIDRFLREYPRSPHCGRASLDRAFVAFGVRPEGGTEDRPWRDEDMTALDGALAEITQRYAGTTAGGLALVWRLIIADEPAPTAILPEMRAMNAQLDEQYGHNREVQKLLWPYRGAARVRLAGIDGFDGTDLGGTRWTAASFKGNVTLIHFWATWCGPCVAEIPTIRRAWSEYHDEGLTVVGVSLDFDDRAQFEGWLSRNDVSWPQIWDGRGFSTPLAKRYEVRAIPFTVLVDRGGHVTNVNLRGENLLTRIRALLDLAH